MKLLIYSTNGNRVINLSAHFFLPSRDTPRKKAEDLSLDIYGRSLKGFVLEENGEEVYNSFKMKDRGTDPVVDKANEKSYSYPKNGRHHVAPRGSVHDHPSLKKKISFSRGLDKS